MKKKILVLAFSLVCLCTTVYAMDNTLHATINSTYNAGGNVTGRVNMAPSGISGSNIGMKKGDKVLMGTKNPANNQPLQWLLMRQDTYTDYNCGTVDAVCVNSPITAWLSLTVESIGNMKSGLTAIDFEVPNAIVDISSATRRPLYTNFRNVKTFITDVNKIIHNNIGDNKILAYRNLTNIHTMVLNINQPVAKATMQASVFSMDETYTNNIYLPSIYELLAQGIFSASQADITFEKKDLSYSTNYMTSNATIGGGNDFCLFSIRKEGGRDIANCPNTAFTEAFDIRPQAHIDLSDVVFSVSTGNSQDITNIMEPLLPENYTALYKDAQGEAMKLRLKNTSLTANLSKIQGNLVNDTEITKAAKNATVYINANANANASSTGVNTVSALIFQHNDITGNDDFKYYKPLETAKGDGLYELDTTGMEMGKYKISIVNEVYNEASTTPADCSAMSDVKNLEIETPIIEVPISNLAFTPTSNLKYNSNVNVGSTVGTIASSNGAGTPVYTLVADPAHASDVAKFELGTDGKTVQVKGNALDAVTYYFKVQAQDANGHPTTPLEINATITVSKSSATIAFTEPTQTKKSMSDAQTSWNETATNTPSNNDLKVTYSKKSGDIGIITLDSDTGSIQASSANAKGKVMIQATVDDNPSTGKDNYEATSTTKEIMIYQEVNGSVSPDPASSDVNNPTFGAMDANVKIGGNIGVITGSEGTPDNGISGTTTYTYGLKSDGNASYFSVNSTTGAITSKVNLSVETYNITVTVSDKWSTKEIPVIISVGQASAEALKFYDINNKNTIITTQSASLNDSAVSVFAEVKGSSNTNTVKYGIKNGASTTVVDVHPTSGAITIKSVGTTTITATKQGDVGQAEAYSELTFTVTEGIQNFIYVDNAGNELSKNTDGSYQSYKEAGKDVVYQKDKTFQLYTNGAPAGAVVTYALKSGSPIDVIQVDEDGKVHILNASLPIQTDKIIVEATSSDPNGNYTDKTIEIAVNIAKADATISFNGVSNVVSGIGSVDPLINDQDISSNEGGVSVADTQYIISVDESISNDIAWTNDGISINYDYSDEAGMDIPLKVIKPANRNYNKAEATGTLHILSPTENILEVSTPGKITYGDTFTIRSLQDDSSSTNVVYTFTSKDTSYIKENTQTANQMKFDAIQASGSSQIEVDIERSADGELPLKKTIKVKVLPKDITIKVDDKEKLYGEENPTFTHQDFNSQLVSWNAVTDVILPSDIKLISNASQTSMTGSYDINVDIAHLNKTYSNYNFKFTKGTLVINEDQIQDDWYHMETSDGKPYTATWTNQDVKILPDHPDYTELSSNKQVWQTELLVRVEGKTNQNFYMKKASGAISSSKEEILLIDKTPPKITSIKGINTPKSRIGDLLNAVSFQTYYKPGVFIEIQVEDEKPIPDIEISDVDKISYKLYEKGNTTPIETNIGSAVNGKLSFKLQNHGEYKVCATVSDKAGNQSLETCEEIEVKKIDVDVDGDNEPDFNDPDGNGCPDLNIKWKNPDNSWTKLNIDQDGDGVPEMNIDSVGDGVADLNVDSDNDGKPDLNLVVLTKEAWNPAVCVTTQPERYCTGTSVKAQINIDLDDDMQKRIPDINININGGMEAEINITKPNETKPYLNIASIHSTWTPNKDYTYEKFNYDTDTSYKAILNVDSDGDGRPDLNIDFVGETAGSPPDNKPDINIDADGNGIPETDIDTDGDGKPDINIDKNKDGKPDENKIEIKEWKPEKDSDKDGFLFDTMGGLNGNDELKDNDVIVSKPGGSFLPNFSLKANKVTDTVSEVIKGDIMNKANGQVIEEIYDVKLIKDTIQIQPDGKLEIKLPIPEGINNPHLVVAQKDGTYMRVTPEIKDGYLVYESDFIGRVGIVGDHRDVEPPKEEVPSETPKNEEPTPDTGGIVKQPDTSVKGTYTTTGSTTGDSTQLIGTIVTMFVSAVFIIILRKRYQKDTI